MRSVRVFYRKNGPLRFVSHLDMSRLVTRMLRRTGLQVWYTEGFNSRLYINFALPLSLGFTSNYECFDFKLQQDTPVDFANLKQQLIAAAPPGLEIFNLAEPVNKTGKIAAAEFKITLQDPTVYKPLLAFLAQPEIITAKKTKKGAVKQLNLAPLILAQSLTPQKNSATLTLKLPAGGENNINPTLLLKAFSEQTGLNPGYAVCRTALYLANGNKFI